MRKTAQYVWIDKGLKSAAEATVPFLSAGLHYGFSVFEGIRCYAAERGPAIFRLEDHVDRLLDSAHIISLRDLPYTRESLVKAINQTVAANDFAACYIRPLIYLEGALNMVVEAFAPR